MTIKTLYLLFIFAFLGSPSLCAQADTEEAEAIEVQDFIVEDDEDVEIRNYKKHHATPPEEWSKKVSPSYLEENIQRENGAQEKWAKKKEEISFNQQTEKAKEEPSYKRRRQDNNSFEGFNWGNKLQNLFIFLGCLFIIGLIVYFVQNGSFRQGKKILVDISDERLDWIEENLPEADVLTPLESAIQAKEYRKAIRLYFLLIVQQLTNAGDINWQKEKTNRAYILETYTQNYHQDFKSCVRIYESVWYGERQVSSEDFQKLEPVFKELSAHLSETIQPQNEE